ncbi:DRTGG domain-containing protein [Suicoccus acidiformans]
MMEMTSKQRQVIHYIESLPIGEKISVRSIAQKLNMSDGTAYRGIKAAEEEGLVTTIDRVGTIRIEKRKVEASDLLTYREVARMVDGQVLGGEAGLDRQLNKFIIGAMTEDAIQKYLSPNTLMIVGNRQSVQRQALENNIAVLVTGGFGADQAAIRLADEKQLPIISTVYDTFAVATMINRSILNQEIQRDIVTVDEIYTPIEKTVFLEPTDTVASFHHLAKDTGLSRFPVQSNQRAVGVVTAKDLMGYNEDTLIERVMTKELVTVHPHMSIATVSHRMIWEDIEMLPVVSLDYRLLGVVSRQDVMRAMQSVNQQPQNVNTFEDEMMVFLEDFPINPHRTRQEYDYKLTVQPQMINNLGTISYGVLTEIISQAASRKIADMTSMNPMIEKIDLHYFNFIQIGNELQIAVDIFNQTRRSALIEVDVYHENRLSVKAIITCQLIEQK